MIVLNMLPSLAKIVLGQSWTAGHQCLNRQQHPILANFGSKIHKIGDSYTPFETKMANYVSNEKA